MSFQLTILGSGSSGNCAYLETETTRLLVDAGFSGKQIVERLTSIGKSPSDLHAILITHEHSDHVQGLKVLGSRYRIPIYSNRLTQSAILENTSSSNRNSIGKETAFDWRIFETGQTFGIGDFDIEPFTIPHDASDPVGFLIYHQKCCAVFLTDLGHVNHLVLEKARQANTLVLETNHDLKLLRDDPHRPWAVKQRISGRHGHLSNEAAAAALGDLMTDRLQHIYLSHLSQDCNRPELAETAIQKRLVEIEATHVRFTLTHQHSPCSTETLGSIYPTRIRRSEIQC